MDSAENVDEAIGEAIDEAIERQPETVGWAGRGNRPDPLRPTDPRGLGPYRLIGRLGEGGMGTVYLGQDAEARPVAIKVIRADVARIPRFRARFAREARIARRVARFCTAEILDVVDAAAGPPYIVTEFVEGPTLAQEVWANGPLGPADLERVAVSVAAALTAIHDAGLVHRDLTPSNVLLSPLGPRVIDFGIAQAEDSTTMSGNRIVGTPSFMAPEQAMADAVTSAADVFAWGGLVIFAGTGRRPFGDGPTATQLYRIVHTDPVIDGLDPGLAEVVRSAMCRDPRDRPDAEEILRRMIRLGASLDAVVTGPLSAAPDVPPGPPPAAARSGDRLPGGELSSDRMTESDRAGSESDRAGSESDRAGSRVSQGGIEDAPTGLAPGQRPTGAPPAEAPVLADRSATGRPRRRGLIGLLALAVVLAAALTGVGLTLRSGSDGPAGDPGTVSTDLVVPAGLVGQPADDAERRLREVGFGRVQRTPRVDAARAGIVLAVSPGSGSRVARSTALTLTVSTKDTSPVAIPAGLVGTPASDARARLERLALTVTTRTDTDGANQAAGLVEATDPPAGTQVARASVVRLTVVSADADSRITVPDVVGQTSQPAAGALHAAGLAAVNLVYAASDRDADTVVASDPTAGTAVPRNATVTLTVSTGAEHTTVDDVVGRTELNARSSLTTAGLNVVVKQNTGPSTVGPGLVEKVEPAAGTQVPYHTTVTITVASSQVAVPSVVGQRKTDAERLLVSYGFDVTERDQASDQPPGTVLAQTPEAGIVTRGTSVTLTLARPATAGGDGRTTSSPPPP